MSEEDIIDLLAAEGIFKEEIKDPSPEHEDL